MSADIHRYSGAGRPPRDPAHYRGWPDSSTREAEVFAGLAPRNPFLAEDDCVGTGLGQVGQRSILGGIPLIMTGSLAAGVGVTGAIPVDHAAAARASEPAETRTLGDMVQELSARLGQAIHPVSHAVSSTIAPQIPDTYTVVAGDTVSAIADRFGLPTLAVLSLNGLHVDSLLHEGQVLKLTSAPTKKRQEAPARVAEVHYVIQPGDTLSGIAGRLGISQASLMAANRIDASTQLISGTILTVPGTRVDTSARVLSPLSRVGLGSSGVVAAGFSATTELSASAPATEQSSLTDEDAEGADEVSSTPVDPLSADIAPAPQLRVVKKATPPPPPPPPPVVEQKNPPKEEPRSTSGSSTSSSSSSGSGGKAGQPVSGAITPLNDVRRENARIIVQVGRDLGVPDYGIVIALATAMQESSLRNIDWGDRDSVGLFQQRPSSGWGSAEQIMDPAYATRAFFGGPNSPTPGRTRGLLNIRGWQDMSLTDAAQAVQISAYPQAYAKWEASAWAWLQELS